MEGLSSYIQIKLILAAQLRNSCQVLRKPNLAGKPPVKFKTYQIDFHSTAAGQPAKLQTTNSFYNFAGCSTAMLGNKVALFRTWQAAMQLCLGIGLIWSELGRYPHSNAATISFIRFQFGSLLCSHVAGISLIRLELGRLLCGCAVGISLICVKLGSLLCSGAGIRVVPLCLHSHPILNGPITHVRNSVTAWSVVSVLQVTIVPVAIRHGASPMVWFRQRRSLYVGKCMSLCCQICLQY